MQIPRINYRIERSELIIFDHLINTSINKTSANDNLNEGSFSQTGAVNLVLHEVNKN
jgi:hypothetical protein